MANEKSYIYTTSAFSTWLDMEKDDRKARSRVEVLAELVAAKQTSRDCYLNLAEFSLLTARDIPMSVSIHWPYGSGYFLKVRGKGIIARFEYSWGYNDNFYPLDCVHCADLVKRSVEIRMLHKKDVAVSEEFDDGETLFLEVELRGLPNGLREAFDYALLQQSALEGTAAEVNTECGRILQSAIVGMTTVSSNESLHKLITRIEIETEPANKGKILEELVARLLQTVRGFTISTRIRTQTEEIDIFVENGSGDPLLKREKAVILVECKNWSHRCGKDEYVLFREKIVNRQGRCSLGVLVSWNGFAKTITAEMLRGSREDALVILLSGHQLKEAVRDDDFIGVFRQAWRSALAT